MIPRCLTSLFCAALVSASIASAQSPAAAPATPAAKPAVADGVVILDVNVKDSAGKAISGLKASDFTLTDEGKTISPFAFMTLQGEKAPVEGIVLFDALPLDFVQIAYARSEILRFLRANGGKLPHPMALAWLQKEKSQTVKGGAAVVRDVSGGAGHLSFIPYSRDGNALAAEFDKSFIGEAPMLRAQGGDGAAERTQITLDALAMLTEGEMFIPGRKLLLWVGLELVPTAGSNGPSRESFFKNGVYFQDHLRRARMDLTFIDATGQVAHILSIRTPRAATATMPGTAGPGSTEDARGYGDDRSGAAPKTAADASAITLQALAKRTGGAFIQGGDAISAELAKCLADADDSYALGYRPGPSAAPNDYHATAVSVDTPGAKVTTSRGYYWGVATGAK